MIQEIIPNHLSLTNYVQALPLQSNFMKIKEIIAVQKIVRHICSM